MIKKTPLYPIFYLSKTLKKMFSEEEEENKEEIRKISITEFKENKYKELDTLANELLELSNSMVTKIKKIMTTENDLQDEAKKIKRLFEYGDIQVNNFEKYIDEYIKAPVENKIDESTKENNIKIYQSRLEFGRERIQAIGNMYRSYCNNHSQREIVTSTYMKQCLAIQKLLSDTIPDLYQYISMGVDIFQAERINKDLRLFIDESNKFIQDSSNKLLISVQESNKLFIESSHAISDQTMKVVEQNNKKVAQLNQAAEEKNRLEIKRNLEAARQYITQSNSNEALLQESNRQKELKLLNSTISTKNN